MAKLDIRPSSGLIDYQDGGGSQHFNYDKDSAKLRAAVLGVWQRNITEGIQLINQYKRRLER